RRRHARLLSTDATGDHKVINATYLLTAPDGTWDAADNGRYSVRVERRSVRDLNGIPSGRRTIGQFFVRIPAISPAPLPSAASFQMTPARIDVDHLLDDMVQIIRPIP